MSDTPAKGEGTGPLPKPPQLKGQVWDMMTSMLREMLDDAETSVHLRRVDLEAFDNKLRQLEGKQAKSAQATLHRLSERREALEEEISTLEKHADDFRFLTQSLEQLKSESVRRDELQSQALAQISDVEEVRSALEERIATLESENDELSRGMETVGRLNQDVQADLDHLRTERNALHQRLAEMNEEIADLTRVLDIATGNPGGQEGSLDRTLKDASPPSVTAPEHAPLPSGEGASGDEGWDSIDVDLDVDLD